MRMASSVAELISEKIDAMPTGERRAAQTLIAAYQVVGLKTVAEFSQQAGVSSPTILRFVARLGFQNYPEFQSALQDELAAPLIAALQALDAPVVGVNQPYSPADRVYFTLEHHGRSRGLSCAMIEIRNDEISAQAGQRKWADMLTGIFADLEPEAGEAVPYRPGIGRAAQSKA